MYFHRQPQLHLPYPQPLLPPLFIAQPPQQITYTKHKVTTITTHTPLNTPNNLHTMLYDWSRGGNRILFLVVHLLVV
jgi:hypothetical protein